MIIYFASRMLDILGMASTSSRSRFTVVEDTKTEDAQTGIGTFEFKIAFDDSSRLELEEMLRVGNCVLRSGQEGDAGSASERYTIDSSHDFFTVTETEIDVKDRTIYVYAEDAGLDLINDLAPARSYSAEVGIENYINDFAGASGFTIRENQIPNETRKLSWDSESTVAERLQSIAESFDCDLSFAFEVQGLRVTSKYIDILASEGAETDVVLYMDKDVSNITVKESIANLATALYPTGKDGLTLSGYEYDDGDFYTNGNYLFSRTALESWKRFALNSSESGDVYRTYSCDATTQLALCEEAVARLKVLRDPEVNYEVDIRRLSAPVSIRDRISIVDDKGELYLSAKVLQLETSITAGTVKATLGDYIMQSDGISDRVMALVGSFANLAKSRYIWIAYADDGKGTGITLDPAGKAYMGISVNRLGEEADISDPSVYTWSKVEGETGATGPQGPQGATGATGAAGADAITMAITSSNGFVFKNTAVNTVLTAHVYQAGKELTASTTPTLASVGTIKWYKDGSTTAVGTGQTLTIDADDVTDSASYTAKLEG